MQELKPEDTKKVTGGVFGAAFLIYIQIHGIIQNFKS